MINHKILLDTSLSIKKLLEAYKRTKDESLIEIVETMVDVMVEIIQEDRDKIPDTLSSRFNLTDLLKPTICPEGVYVYGVPEVDIHWSEEDNPMINNINITDLKKK